MRAEMPLTESAAVSVTVARPGRRGLANQAVQFALVAALGFLSYFVISHFFLQSVTVVGLSMAPTLSDSQRYLLNRWIYHYRAPACSEIVVIEDPVDHGFSVKRVVARSGDSVYITEGEVYVNGLKLNEPYLVPGTRTFTCTAEKEKLFKCGPNQFFVLGDNRMNSADSRLYGPVPRQYILGQIIP